MFRKITLAVGFVLIAAPGLAGPTSDAVRYFYTPVKWEADPASRDRFTGPAKALFDLNDKTPEGEIGCIDFGPGIDAQDYDDDTIGKTLKLSESVQGDTATVTATFALFPDHSDEAKREIRWLLAREAGTWKIADIVSVTSGWTLSDLECLPEG
jgi:hypothetical protein